MYGLSAFGNRARYIIEENKVWLLGKGKKEKTYGLDQKWHVT